MHSKYKKIYCCTPIAFPANAGFWIRDTGLISTSLREMGVESKCIMPLPHHDDDHHTSHLIRTKYENLSSVSWWKSLEIDAVILYSWGAPRYTLIARAIRKAGIKLVLHMDTSGNFEGCDYSELPFLKKLRRLFLVKLHDLVRSCHMRYADVITCSQPAASAIRERLFYGTYVEERNYPFANPVASRCKYNGENKENVILAVGRWNDERQKRSRFLMLSLECLYKGGCSAETKIFGSITDEMRDWHRSLAEDVAEKIRLEGYLENSLLHQEFCKAKIILCPSRYEGSHIVSAEALCCGVSVVVTNLPKTLRTPHWYTTKNSGRVSAVDSPESFAEAVRKELQAWDAGERNPVDISDAWQPYFHVDKVMNQIFKN